MKALINIRGLLACAALAAIAPAVSAQVRPTFYGQPALDRASHIADQDVDPALARIHQLGSAGEDWSTAARIAGATVQDGRLLVESPRGNRDWFAPGELAGIAGLDIVRQPVANSSGAPANEAYGAMLADKYAALGLIGGGVRIAVIDLGFGGIDQNRETSGTKRYQKELNVDAEVHGTAMIEAIRGVAPGAEIVAIRLDAETDITRAVEMAGAFETQIIVCPLSWFEMPGEGTACEVAAKATACGMLWVNAAGNFGDQRYFEGENLPTMNIGGNEFVDFGGDPYQFVNGMQGGDTFSVHFASTGAMQLELYRWDGLSATFVLVEQGKAGAAEQVVSHEYVAGMYYFPMVRQVAAGPVAPFRMFAIGGDLHFSMTQGSIANPAGMAGVISVGAVNVNNYAARTSPETYSSLGGGIFDLTLTLCGPTGCTTGTYGSQGFAGTSAACANIAGLLALQLADALLAADPLGNLKRVDIGGVDIAYAMVDEFESDNDEKNATPLLLDGVSANHIASPSNDEDWFSFEVAETSLVHVAAPGCVIEIMNRAAALSASEAKSILQAGTYLVRITADSLVAYDVSIEIDSALPGRVETVMPGSGTEVEGNSVELIWVPVAGIGNIGYLVEVAVDPSFDRLVLETKTTLTSIWVKGEAGQSLYWRVTAFNEFGSAQPSDVFAIRFAAGDETQLVSVLSIDQPTQTGSNDAAGCTGTNGAQGLAALLAAMLIGAAIVRTRRVKA